ncbi:DUF6629 family protein [Hyphococcus luteus]|uniref:Uncharacterized protein n=1 Tax=Hyphococcus luteus TaxID=2058213 RepID=A0A2S7K5T3_9PROT|nr:DUF6629 family protein [Marinicaulis flavus]PQA87874.1 hypothetical protein CW354_05850 [Marinicaulis flavus]
MCFSATASFTAAAVLGAVGAATLAQKPKPRDMAFAAIPLIFAAHQTIEGAIWLHLNQGDAVPNALVVAFLLIAQVLWPVYIPASVIAMEKDRKRPGLWVLLAAGVLVSGTLAYILIFHHYTVSAVADGLRYATDHEFERRLLALYLLATVAPLFLSRHFYVVMFGAATLLGAVVTVLAYFYAAASVWCFFSAVASVIVFLHVRRSNRAAPDEKNVGETSMNIDAA